MLYAEAAVRLLLLVLSFGGYVLYLKEHMRVEFSIGWIGAFIGSVMFAAGMLRVLMPAAWLVFALGLVLLGVCVLRRRAVPACSAGLVFFVLAAAFFLVLLHNSKFENVDNFTHWAVAARSLIETDRFPDTDTYNFMFTSYPLGSACFIYYVTEIVGIHSEWMQMWAQAVLMAALITGVFGCGGTLENILVAAGGAVMLLCGSISFVDLLVDTLLSVTAVGIISFCVYYREKLGQKLLFLVPYVIFLVSIKNSGVFLVMFILLYVLYRMERTPGNLLRWAAVLACAFAALYFWNVHVDLVFGKELSMHDMSLANYRQMFAAKTAEERMLILTRFGKQFVTDLKLIAALLLTGAGIYGLARHGKSGNTGEIRLLVIFVGFSYFVYQLGMLIMYLFSMKGYEAIYLAAYDRYLRTILTFCIGILMMAFQLGVRNTDRNLSRGMGNLLAAGIFLVLVWGVLQPNFSYYTKQQPLQSQELEERETIASLIRDYQIEEHLSYAVIIGDDRLDQSLTGYQRYFQMGLLKYMLKYQLDTDYVDIDTTSDIGDYDLEYYDYVILYDETEEGRAVLTERFGEPEARVICNFKPSN